MLLRMITEEHVEIYRDSIMEEDARCVGYGSSCLGVFAFPTPVAAGSAGYARLARRLPGGAIHPSHPTTPGHPVSR